MMKAFGQLVKKIIVSLLFINTTKETQPRVMKRTLLFLFVFFLMIVLYFTIVISPGSTTVHLDKGDFAIRDFGMLLDYLDFGHSKNPGDFLHKLRLLFDYGMVQDDAPLQFWLANVWVSLIVRNLLPLTSTVMLFPKTIIGAIAGIYAFLLGKKLYTRRFGIIFALVYCLSPWYGIGLRYSTWYPQLISLLHMVVIYHYTDFILDKHRLLFRLMAPLSLAIYLTAGLDWPFFIPVLLLYLILNRCLKAALCNWYNLIPLGMLGLHVYFTIRISGLFGPWEYGLGRWKHILLTYPFFKVSAHFNEVNFSPKVIIYYLDCCFSPAWRLAIVAALVIVLFYLVKSFIMRKFILSYSQSLSLLMSCWLILEAYPFIRSGTPHSTYAFVVAVPIIFLASFVIRKIRLPYIVILLLYMGYLQWALFFNFKGANDYRIQNIYDDDRRVLAVATFLIEKRPDLLEKNKIALLPNYQNVTPDNPYYINYYAKGYYTRIESWMATPQENGIPVSLLGYMKSRPEITGNDIIKYIDWIVLSDGIVLDKIPWKDLLDDYYIAFLSDPRINWLGRFRDAKGREIYLGEVSIGPDKKNVNFEDTPVYDADELANVYERKYNYLKYLKSDLPVHMYFW